MKYASEVSKESNIFNSNLSSRIEPVSVAWAIEPKNNL